LRWVSLWTIDEIRQFIEGCVFEALWRVRDGIQLPPLSIFDTLENR